MVTEFVIYVIARVHFFVAVVSIYPNQLALSDYVSKVQSPVDVFLLLFLVLDEHDVM